MKLFLIYSTTMSVVFALIKFTTSYHQRSHMKTYHYSKLFSTVSYTTGAKSSEQDVHFMQLALRHAQFSFRDKEVPVGAVIVDENNKVLAAARNTVERSNDCTMHAEIDCIRKASFVKQNWRLNDCVLYTTLEPCPMCLAAIQAARIKKVVFGAYTAKNLSNQIDIPASSVTTSSTSHSQYSEVNPPSNTAERASSIVGNANTAAPSSVVTLEIVGGILEEESVGMLKRFFQQRRFEASNTNSGGSTN